jgi:hypothetical protein
MQFTNVRGKGSGQVAITFTPLSNRDYDPSLVLVGWARIVAKGIVTSAFFTCQRRRPSVGPHEQNQ